MNTERDLKARVVEELEWEPSVDARDVRMTASDGVITLHGTVSSHAERVAAERVAKAVRGVRAVVNDLTVKLPLAHRRRDDEIAEAAAQMLGWDVFVPPDAVRVRVIDGWVELGGSVDWHYQRSAAEAAVERLVGIRGVSNHIAVPPTTEAGGIRSRIEAALRRRADLAAQDAQRIEVQATGNKVLLRGQVHSWGDRALAEAAAWRAPGVTAVEDELEVVADELKLEL